MQPQVYTSFFYPRLNGWFQPAYESLIKAANRKSGWDAFDEDAPAEDSMPKQYARDYCAVASLIRVCAAWKDTRDQIAGQLRRPFSLTVVETGESEWVEATGDAFSDGLIPAICSNNPDATKPKIVCYKSRWRKTTPAKTASDFNEALALAAKEPASLIVIVPSIEVLPDAFCKKSAKIISLSPLSRSMILMLYAMMHGRQCTALMTKALNQMPSHDALAQISANEIMLALRTPKLMAFVLQLNKLTTRTKANPEAMDDVKGLGAARAPLKRLVDDIQAYSDGHLSWADIPNNLLLDGPPGVGKTFVAQKLAEATGAHFVGASYAAWQAEGHAKAFRKCKSRSLCCLERNPRGQRASGCASRRAVSDRIFGKARTNVRSVRPALKSPAPCLRYVGSRAVFWVSYFSRGPLLFLVLTSYFSKRLGNRF
ncbi:AAA family ATPase [Ruegeria sp. HKCCA5763]|uniref:AAA family ATPase n=1 Tax=Ruegeria sp. HKCCA5763 TaxID=2682987 RepID=UPI001488ADA6|nr:AAA family ATPase [Ruegeria sp. HKCCA5763]